MGPLSRIFILVVSLGLLLPSAGDAASQPAVYKGAAKPRVEVPGLDRQGGVRGQAARRANARYPAPGVEVLLAKAPGRKKKG
jgi:hypothetical protein